MKATTPHILLVEDSEMHAELIRDALAAWSDDIRLTIAPTLAAARTFLEHSTPDLALIDLMLPDGRGLELLPADREHAAFPCVLLTGSGDEQTAVEAIKAGALDYVIKSPATLSDIPYIVERAMREWKNIVLRRQAETALRESEERFRSTFEQAAVGIAHASMDGRWLRVNQRLCDILGYRKEELLRKTFQEITHPDDLEESLAHVGQLCGGEVVSCRFEKRYIHKAGHTVWVNLTETLQRDSSGVPLYLIAVIEDISERRRMEAEKERLLAELDATINSIADGVVVYGPEMTIVRMNPAAEKILGPSPQGVKEPLSERVARLRVETAEGAPFALTETPGWRALHGETVHGSIMVLHPPGRAAVWASASAAPIRNGEGRLLGAVATFSDITAMRELQQEREIFLHTVSHDLRTPLTVIQGYAQLLRETLMREGCGESAGLMCDEVLKGAQRMNRMIEALVDVARLEGGQLVPKASTLLLGSFVQQLLGRLQGVRLKGFLETGRLTAEIPADLPPVMADPDLLERILLNLLTNAMKYSPAESPVRLEARRKEGEIEISVIDRGEGIAPEDQSCIFERFCRLAGVRRGDSVGLGLYITRKLVEAQGGSIRVESAPGEGSTFFFTLPLA
ncbi:MAG TPA: PAS domain S-box protein [Desulfuromonadales bacterium]